MDAEPKIQAGKYLRLAPVGTKTTSSNGCSTVVHRTLRIEVDTTGPTEIEVQVQKDVRDFPRKKRSDDAQVADWEVAADRATQQIKEGLDVIAAKQLRNAALRERAQALQESGIARKQAQKEAIERDAQEFSPNFMADVDPRDDECLCRRIPQLPGPPGGG